MNVSGRTTRATRRAAMLVVAVVLATGCSRVPNGGQLAIESGFGPHAVATDPTGDATQPVGNATPGRTPPRGSQAPVQPGATSAPVDTPAQPSAPQAPAATATEPGTSDPGAEPSVGPTIPGDDPTGPTTQPPASDVLGVNGDTVHVVVTGKFQDCGDSPTTSSGGTLDKEASAEMVEQFLEFWNNDVLAPYGWKVTYEFIDDGGVFCPEKTRAAAQQIIREIQPFAVLGLSVNAESGPIMADLVTDAGFRHIGVNFNTFDELEARRGLAFNEFIPAQLSYEYLEAYIATRVKGTQVADPTTGVMVDRRYGMVVADVPEYRKLAGIMKQRLAARGVDLEQTYFVSADPGVAGQTATNTVNKMRADGINSLIFDFFPNGFLSGITLSKQMAGQNYRPDLLTATYWFPLIDSLHDLSVWENVHGVASKETLALRSAIVADDGSGKQGYDPRYVNVAENSQPMMSTWKDHMGNDEDPGGDGVLNPWNFWTQMSILSLGLINAGDVLTAESFAEGVWSTALGETNRCGAWRLMGRESPYHFASSLARDRADGTMEWFTTIYWINKPAESVLPVPGYYESFDNYRFFQGIDDLPPEATHDTGKQGVEHYTADTIGIKPWISCTTFGMTD